jgi:aspartate-semialdehyde dehydrogenase
MTPPPAGKPGLRVGIAGASSLLGQEIIRVLSERHIPVARLSKFDPAADEDDLPVLDLSGQEAFDETEPFEVPSGLDLLFLAVRARSKPDETDIIGKALEAAGLPGAPSAPTPCPVIDAVNALANVPGRKTVIPSSGLATAQAGLGSIYISPHPATIVLARILLRLKERFALQDCVAQAFLPASELGPRGIEELQKQTVNLLSFQKFPQKVFGAQLAFNVLSRLSGKQVSPVSDMEITIRRELRDCLASTIRQPALRFFHAPVFYSLSFSIFVELKDKPCREAVASALSGPGLSVRLRSESAPNPVDAAGSGEIILDAITCDSDRPGGFWIWAVVDNIRLAAENAVEIAQSCLRQPGLKQ